MSDRTLVIEGNIRFPLDRPSRQTTIVDRHLEPADGTPGGPTRLRWRLPPTATLLPAFRDPHLHLAAMAARILSTDCTASTAPDLPTLFSVLSDAVSTTPKGAWIRGFGFDDSLVAERRPPTLDELDRTVPSHPLLIRHQAGYEAYVNSAALRMLAGRVGRTDGQEALIDTDTEGRPTGRLVGLDARSRLGLPPFEPRTFERAVQQVGRHLAAAGIVEITDAGASNDVERVNQLASLTAGGRLPQRVTVMISPESISAAAAAGIRFGSRMGGIRVGHVKVVAGDDPATARNDPGIVAANRSDWPIAVHATSIGQVGWTVLALGSRPGPTARDRVEHLSVALPEQLDEIARYGCAVTTQPLFPVRRWTKYAEAFEAAEHGWLYPVASLIRRRIPVAFSSDAPVSDARPLAWIAAAVRRADGSTRPGSSPEAIDRADALAASTGTHGARGRGASRPDLVVLSDDPFTADPAELDTIEVLATLRAGQLIHLSDTMKAPAGWPWHPATKGADSRS